MQKATIEYLRAHRKRGANGAAWIEAFVTCAPKLQAAPQGLAARICTEVCELRAPLLAKHGGKWVDTSFTNAGYTPKPLAAGVPRLLQAEPPAPLAAVAPAVAASSSSILDQD